MAIFVATLPKNETGLFRLRGNVDFAVNRQSIDSSHDAMFPVVDETLVFADIQRAIRELGIVAILVGKDHDHVLPPQIKGAILQRIRHKAERSNPTPVIGLGIRLGNREPIPSSNTQSDIFELRILDTAGK